jgi:hypothetical protein
MTIIATFLAIKLFNLAVAVAVTCVVCMCVGADRD